MIIRQAKISDLPAILQLTTACTAKMIANGIFQWTDHYPDEFIFRKDIELGQLYILADDKLISGTIVISKIMDEEYVPINWLAPTKNNLYIHRLAVHPKFQGNGYAQLLMDFAENLGSKFEAPSIRLDTFSQNKRNQKFYEVRGYQKLSDIFFPNQSHHPFHCYELVL